MSRKRGFSLVELLVVIMIISFLSLAVSFGTKFLAARAETASSMQVLKDIVNAIAEVERNGVNVVVRPGDAAAGANGAMKRADGMFESGQAEIETVLGYSLTSLSEFFRFSKITTATQTVGGKTWTRNILRMWRGSVNESTGASNFGTVQTMKLTGLTGATDEQPIELAIPWEKWGTN